MAKHRKKRRVQGAVSSLVCNRCGTENSAGSSSCANCGSERFAPAWVLAKRPINRQVSVEVTQSNAEYGPVQPRITLSKWWPGGRASFHIPSLAQWEAIAAIINNELAPFLNWKAKSELVASLQDSSKTEKATKKTLKALVGERPEIVRQIVEAIDTSRITDENVGEFLDVAAQLADAVGGLDKRFKDAFISVIKKLPREKRRALEDLEHLLGQWSLHQITTVAQQVRARLNTIELFRKQILDDRTYEITGSNSIHRILEASMWLIDERYWLLHANETLRTFIGAEMEKKDRKQWGKKRPDFVCGMYGERLIIIEIKRPSHTLTIDDLNQLETYLTVAEKYKSFRSYEGYLVGNKIDPDLKNRMRHRSNSFRLLTYTDLLEDAEKRYKEYIQAATAS